MNFKYKVRFFTDENEYCFAEFKNSIIPQINTTVSVCNGVYFVDEISYCYGYPDDKAEFVLVDIIVTKIDLKDV